MPRVSVVLPTHNRAPLLDRSIASVLAQTFTDFELLVVDDGSTDETATVMAAIRDPRLRYVKLDSRGGVSRARNRGIELASNAWVAFQDSDDTWLPDKLERQLRVVRDDTVLVVTRDRVVNDESMSYSGVPASAGETVDLMAHATLQLPPAATWLARREVLLATGGFDPALNCYEDWELSLRLATRGRILLVNDVLVLRHKTEGSLFSDEASRLRNLRLIVERHRDTLARDARAWAYYGNAVGQGEAQFGTIRESRVWFLEALRARPLHPRTWANLLASWCGKAFFIKYVALARSIKRLS